MGQVLTGDLALLRIAFELASDNGTSAPPSCDCPSCADTRQQMRDYWLKEAAQIAAENPYAASAARQRHFNET